MRTLTPAAVAVRWWLTHHKQLKLNAKGVHLRNGCIDATAVVEAMTVEGLPHARIPAEQSANVTAFRHLRSDVRVRLVERFLAGHSTRECLWCAS